MEIYIYDDLQAEDSAMLQALYSRSSDSVTKHIEKVKETGSGKLYGIMMDLTVRLEEYLSITISNMRYPCVMYLRRRAFRTSELVLKLDHSSFHALRRMHKPACRLILLVLSFT
jgi:hypothetical protein